MGLRKLFGAVCLCLVVLPSRAQIGAGNAGRGAGARSRAAVTGSGAAGARSRAANYNRRWQVVDSLVNVAGQPASALAEVNRIYTLARLEHNSAQEIKALVFKVAIGTQTTDNDSAGIRLIERRMNEAEQPARSILQSVLALQYWGYLQRNRYRLYNRSVIIRRPTGDFSTWTIDDFHRNIRELFLASLREEELLKRSAVKDWQPILLKGNTPLLRPTLFDLLAQEALNYFESPETDINRPQEIFEMDDPILFSDAATFVAHDFATADSSSPHYQAVLLYQRLLRFHIADAQPDAFIDVDIDRLGFAKIYSVAGDKEDLYVSGLTRLTDKWGDKPSAAQAWYLQARYYSNQAKQSAERPDSGGWDGYIRAKTICDQVLREPDSSEGKANCRELLNEIVAPSVELAVEQYNVPEKPFRCLVKWSNVHRIYLRLARIDTLRKTMRYQQNDDLWQEWLQAPAYRSFSQKLPYTSDHRTHAVEIAIGRLPPGTYVLLASTDDAWDRKKSFISETQLIVTSMAYIRDGRDYFLLNRETGQPVTDARVQVWETVYRGSHESVQPLSGQTRHPDQQGHFQLGLPADNEQRFLELQRPGEDILLSGLSLPDIYGEQWNNVTTDKTAYENGNAVVYFFLDRAIYRPGQTVYFKAITITRDFDTRQPRPMAGRPAKVFLTNANHERIDSLDLVTDEFGSYHGVFHLPDHGLNGRFQINDVAGQPYGREFSVEEYKRPRFYVGFAPLMRSYRVGDSIRVEGSATAYAGNNLDGSMVKYRVTRLARYPSFYGWSPVALSEQEIAHGVLKTGDDGKFRIVFSTRPDRRIPANIDPRFDYRISADVTDINGETRSATTDVTAGYTVLDVSIRLGQQEALLADSLQSIHVEVKNLSGNMVPAVVHVVAYPLAAPVRLIRDRLWDEVPDRWVMSEQAFLDSFPHDPYRDDLKKEKWAKGAMAWEATDSSGGSPLPLRLKAGWWAIEATAADSSGQPVKDIRYVQVFDNGTGGPANPEYLWGGDEATMNVDPGGVARLQTGSSAMDVYVVRAIRRPDTIAGRWHRPDDPQEGTVFRHLAVNGGMSITEWKITETDRGGFEVADAFVKENRLYVHHMPVDVRWDNKKLQIRYRSFRDKTEPGSVEKWVVEVAGYRGRRVEAQVLAAMYDASLDEFERNSWTAPDLYPTIGAVSLWSDVDDFGPEWSGSMPRTEPADVRTIKRYDRLIGVEIPLRGTNIGYINALTPYRGNRYLDFTSPAVKNDAKTQRSLIKGRLPGLSVDMDGAIQSPREAAEPLETASAAPPPLEVRTNFQETAFFFPDLRTDSAGNVSFSFTLPESLTRWKWMTLAHTRDLAFGYSDKTIVAQKQLMVQPNAPRFLREGDKINLTVKVVNLTDSEMTGQMALSLTDPTTGETADGMFLNRQPNQYFTVPARGSSVVEFPMEIPYQYNRPVSYRVVAEAGAFSDGEEAMLPVVSNRMLVTETLPLNMPGDGVRSFKFEKLLRSGGSETLNHHALTVEFTANPAWYAVQALPYLMEYPDECAEQLFDRLYANALAGKIITGSPRIAQVFDRWRTVDTSALMSNLEKDQALKSVLLEETPWVLEGKTGTQQKREMALLFDTTRLSRELGSTIDRLHELQSPDGGFPWFKGGPDDRYVTQYVLTGLGRLQQMQALPPALDGKIRTMVVAALGYADQRIKADYDRDLKVPGGIDRISPFAAQYLYMRSFFNDRGIPGGAFAAVNFYRKVAQRGWVKASKYLQGMVALALFRTGDVASARAIMASLRETAIRNDELGMYWKGMEGGYYWYEAPVETESILIEAFREIGHDTVADRELKTWLLRQKQTHHWRTTKATADAIYALLIGGTDWLDQKREVRVQLGDKEVVMSGEAGTGYDKKIFDAPFIDSSMGNIKVTMSSARGGGSPAWGAVYWQYFDQLDQLTPSRDEAGVRDGAAAGGGAGAGARVRAGARSEAGAAAGGGAGAGARALAPLQVEKRLYVQRNTDRGPVLDTIAENGTLHVGDRVIVRIVLRSDRDLEFVHLKDMRGACLEPVNVLSGYRWQGGLGYYESTRDVSTEFFFSSIPKGTYVFEYPSVVEQTGEFSNGVASVECMYAPEFASHTEGIRVNVEEDR